MLVGWIFGRMKKKEKEKKGDKMIENIFFWVSGWREEREKIGKAQVFSLHAHQNVFSLK